jgi:hypothetical protein
MRIVVAEIATGYWMASVEGEEADSVIDRSPDQALASLIRVNIRRLGIEAIVYQSEATPPVDSSIPFSEAQRGPRPPKASGGEGGG